MDPFSTSGAKSFTPLLRRLAKVSRELCDVAIPLDVGDSHLCLCGAVSMVCGGISEVEGGDIFVWKPRKAFKSCNSDFAKTVGRDGWKHDRFRKCL